MNRSRSGRQRTSSRSFAVLAIAVVALLVLGSVVALIPENGTENEGEETLNADAFQVTPGAEVERLQTVVAEDPDDTNSIVVLADILANSGRAAEAVPWYERATASRPDDVSLRLAFGRALQRSGNYFDAELQFRRAVDIAPDNVAAAFYLALLYEQQPSPRLDEAQAWYRKAIEIDPDSVIAGQARDRLTELDGATASPTAQP